MTELEWAITYDVEHDLFHPQNVFSDEYITPTFIEYVQKLETENAEMKAQIEKMKNCNNCANYMINGDCPRLFRTGWCKNWEMTRSKK